MAINGTLEGKYRAAHLIIEQVEIFKNGGPVSSDQDSVDSNLRLSKVAKSLTKILRPRYRIRASSKSNITTESDITKITEKEKEGNAIGDETTPTRTGETTTTGTSPRAGARNSTRTVRPTSTAIDRYPKGTTGRGEEQTDRRQQLRTNKKNVRIF